MKRTPLVLIAVAMLALLGAWLWLLGDPAPGVGETESSRDEVAAVAPEVVPDVARQAVVASQEEGDTASAPQKPAAKVAFGLAGVVKELGGGGVADVVLELVDKNGELIASTVSGEGGRFAFEQPTPTATGIITQLRSKLGPRLRHSVPRGRPGARRSNIGIWIPPPATIEGSVVDAQGQPVAGAVVMSDRPSMMLNGPRWQVLEGPKVQMASFVETDQAGRFVLPSVKRGTHRLTASQGKVDGSAKCKSGDRAVVLQLGTHLGGSVVLAGHLRERGTGVPIAGATVSVHRVRVSRGGSSSIGVGRAVSNEQGFYEAKGFDVGCYSLSTTPDGYAPREQAARDFGGGRHTVDFQLDQARELTVRVVMPDGSAPSGTHLRVLDANGKRLEVPGRLSMLTDEPRVGPSGKVKLRLLPAAPLTLLAVRGDLVPAGRLQVDLSTTAPESVSIVLPSVAARFARRHYFRLLGPDGKPAQFQGAVVAESLVGSELLSRVEGRWRDGEFFFGHEERNGFRKPTIAIGAPKGECRVELTVPGYYKHTLTLLPGAPSPTPVRLRK